MDDAHIPKVDVVDGSEENALPTVGGPMPKMGDRMVVLKRTRKKRQAGFTLAEVVVAALILVLITEAVMVGFSVANKRASRVRTEVAAATIVRDYVGRAASVNWDEDNTNVSILATNAAGTDIDGDGQADGSVFLSNVPIIIYRDTKTGNSNHSAIVGTLYRRSLEVDTNINTTVRRITFLLSWREGNKTRYWSGGTLRAYDE